ncbi:MAG TPA: hypothetical protein VK947_12530 [Planococcus sp. (in: firmicutes)]|nr:hypothetical protein [Planococcus sp. (in: firmicutes)]
MTNKDPNEPKRTDDPLHQEEPDAPKEREYMAENKKTMQRPPEHKEGIEEPRVTGYKPLQVGIVIFAVLVIILIILGLSFDMFGLFN